MSAPVLSPDELARVNGFGIHDEDVTADMAELYAEEPKCSAWGGIACPCSATATHVVICKRCGGQAGLVCALHGDAIRVSRERVIHRGCGARGETGEMSRVVRL